MYVEIIKYNFTPDPDKSVRNFLTSAYRVNPYDNIETVKCNEYYDQIGLCGSSSSRISAWDSHVAKYISHYGLIYVSYSFASGSSGHSIYLTNLLIPHDMTMIQYKRFLHANNLENPDNLYLLYDSQYENELYSLTLTEHDEMNINGDFCVLWKTDEEPQLLHLFSPFIDDFKNKIKIVPYKLMLGSIWRAFLRDKCVLLWEEVGGTFVEKKKYGSGDLIEILHKNDEYYLIQRF